MFFRELKEKMSLFSLGVASFTISSLFSLYFKGHIPYTKHNSSHLNTYFDARGVLELFVFFQAAVLFEGGWKSAITVFASSILGNLVSNKFRTFISSSCVTGGIINTIKFVGLGIAFGGTSTETISGGGVYWLPVLVTSITALTILVGIQISASRSNVNVVDLYFGDLIKNTIEKSLLVLSISLEMIMLYYVM